MQKEIKLEALVICKNKPYPDKNDIWYFTNTNPNNVEEAKVINYMLEEIAQHFIDYDVIIVRRDNIVIDIIRR